jgi:ABC-type nitrate/sulfonate/bicarbonate transport system substrate-binding protein
MIRFSTRLAVLPLSAAALQACGSAAPAAPPASQAAAAPSSAAPAQPSAAAPAASASPPASAAASAKPAGSAAAASKPAAGSAGASAKPGAAKTIKYGASALTAVSWPTYIAEDKGFNTQEGIKLETTLLGSPNNAALALVGGSVDMVETTFDSAIRAVEQNSPVTIIGSQMLRFPQSVIAVAKTPQELKGKRIMMPTATDGTTIIFKKWLTSQGLKPEDFQFAYGGGSPERYAALKSHNTEAGLLSPPFLFQALNDGNFNLFDLSTVTNVGQTAFVAQKKWLQSDGDTARAFLRAYSHAVDWLYAPANKEEAIDILAKATKSDRSVAAETYDYYQRIQPYVKNSGVPNEALQGDLDIIVEQGDIKAPTPPLSKYLDLSYLPK